MTDRASTPRLRSLLVWLAVTAGSAVLLSVLLPLPVSLQGTFEELLVRLSSWALVGCVLWFWSATTAVVLTALRSEQQAWRLRGVPVPVRRFVLLACGAALGAGATIPAVATPGPQSADPADHSGRAILSGLPFPQRATDLLATSPDPAPGAEHVRVPAGDTLWGIAAARLPAGADDASVSAAWRDLYARNRAAVGPDPDRIQPGQILRLPDSLD